ncbi:MAG TPA: class I SAM-dependent methyltransferase [Vicinamibacterales bacterium]
MERLHSTRRSWFTVCLLVIAASVFVGAQATQAPTAPFEPKVGQEGKDVVWVPTPQSLVDKMLDMANVTSQDFVMDLGSGDGRTVITAAKRGARAMGIEYNPNMVELSKRNATKEGVGDKATFVKADLFETDLSKATVITMFLLPDINLKLRPKILNLKPGTRIVSNTFTMEDWMADETERVDNCTSWCTALFWIVPAKVAGTWKLPQGDLTLKQQCADFGRQAEGRSVDVLGWRCPVHWASERHHDQWNDRIRCGLECDEDQRVKEAETDNSKEIRSCL